MTTLEAGNALEVAETLARHLPQFTSQTARTLYRVLVEAAVETGRGRGHAPSVTSVLMHVPLELVALRAGVSRVTAWRHLPELVALGVLAYRTHKASCRGRTRNSGTVWRVRLTPTHGCRVRLSYDDLKHKWRDMDADLRRGRTSYAALKHTKTLKTKSLELESLLAWTLPPSQQPEPVNPVCFSPPRGELESVLDVRHARREERSQMVDLAAQALAQALRDRGGLNWYRKLLWQLLRRSDATGEDHSYSVYMAAVRARVDAREGFARKPGALFISRLKGAPWWDEVMRGPPVRVGAKPVEVVHV